MIKYACVMNSREGTVARVRLPIRERGNMENHLEHEDQKLFQALEKRVGDRKTYETSEVPGISFRNPYIAEKARRHYLPVEIHEIEDTLTMEETHTVTIDHNNYITKDGRHKPIAVVHATEEETGTEMSPKNLWIRDQALVADSKLTMWKLAPKRYKKEGEEAKDILVSTLDIMSTPAQQDRFQDIIQGGDASNFHKWPYIFLETDHLDGEKENKWRHKQDAWQMLVYSTFDALEHGLLHVEDLDDDHKKMLGAAVPFLRAANFVEQPNSGSWEELEAKRTSVLSVETAMLHKIRQFAGKDGYEFLEAGYKALPQDDEPKPFTQALDEMIDQGLTAIAKRLPDEAPDYDKTASEYRTADGALVYALRYGIPKLLADNYQIAYANSTLSEFEIDMLVIGQIQRLEGEFGIKRYGIPGIDESDPYQNTNFHTAEKHADIKALKKKIIETEDPQNPAANLVKKFDEYHTIVDGKNSAQWTLFDPQIASFAAQRYLETKDEQYLTIATRHFNRSLAQITGPGEFNALLGSDGTYYPHHVDAFRLPECYITYEYKSSDGETHKMIVPSPNTPLNWAVSEQKKAFAFMTACAEEVYS